MIPAEWRSREVAVLGLGRSGSAAGRWLAQQGVPVYASDNGLTDEVTAAAAELQSAGVSVDVGSHDLERIRQAAAVVVSPGIPPGAPPVRAAREAGVEIVAELDLAMRALSACRSVVVTGTNGKTTTTALVAHLLCSGGMRATAGGNIGKPLIEVATAHPLPEWIVVEASSFQLHDSPHLKPTVGVVTNLAPDHLNRYASIDAYYADKALLFRNAVAESVWILNGDDDGVARLAGSAPGRRLWWSMERPADAWFDGESNAIMLGEEILMPRARFRLLGEHNVQNALAACLAAETAGVARRDIVTGAASFRPLPHRLEPVREVDGRTWINDSKATNVASTLAALRAMDMPYVLILGGRHKDEPFDELGTFLAPHCRKVIVYGEAGEILDKALRAFIEVSIVHTLEDAVTMARDDSRPGDVVLMSPACTSFDQFRNFAVRGDVFRQLVEAL